MCAIVDANVASEVFSSSPSAAGKKLYDWINEATGRLVVGGKLLKELEENSPTFRDLARELVFAGRMRIENADDVNAKAEEIKDTCISNDQHIIALAQISGARLLYSRDRDLQEDFKNRELINRPRGKVYPDGSSFTKAHKRLLGQSDLCQK